VAVVAALSFSPVTLADDSVADGDGATPVSPAINPLIFGNVCIGATYVDTALVAIKRAQVEPDTGGNVAGNNLRVFNDGATVTVSVLSDESGDISESVPDNTIVLPSNWEATALGTMSTDTATIEVTLVPTATAAQSKKVFIRARGRNRTDTQDINRDSNFAVTWTPVDCPDVTINQAGTQADPTSTSPIHFTAVFNEPVSGFTDSDVSLGGTAGPTTAVVTEIAPNDDTTYDVAVSGMTSGGTVIASIPAGAALDTSSNPSTASTSTDNTVTYIFANVLNALSDVHAWVGLKNSDDQGTQFDVRAELLQNGTPVATGLTRCVTGVTRNPTYAKDVVIVWDASFPIAFDSADVISLRLSTRIGTTSTDTKCSGPGGSHNNAVGLRLYYDSTNRPSRFDWTLTPDPNTNEYLHSNGNACLNAPSANVTMRTFDSTAPTATSPKCKDSTSINFAGGNLFKEIGTWSMTLP
jgi:hypothetical protein